MTLKKIITPARTLRLAVAVTLFLTAACTISYAANQDLSKMLPKSGDNIEILDLGADPKIQKSMLKLQQVAEQNPQWFSDYTRKYAKPGQPLPYSPKFGMSKSEFDEMIAGMSGGGIKLIKLREAKATVDTSGSQVTIKIPTLKLLAGGISINPSEQGVQVSGLSMTTAEPFDNKAGGPVPPNAGYSWSKNTFSALDQQRITNLSELEKVSGKLAKVTVSRVTGTDKCLMTVDIQSLSGGQKDRVSEYVRYRCI